MSATFHATPVDLLVGPAAIRALPGNALRKYLRVDNKSGALVTVKLGQFSGPLSAVQLISFARPVTHGTWSLLFNGQETAVMDAATANAAAVQAALEALSTIGAGNVVVAGDYSAGFTVTFAGTLANADQPQLIVNVNTLASAQASSVQRVKFAATAFGGSFTLAFRGVSTGSIAYNASAAAIAAALNAISTIDGDVASVVQDSGPGDYLVTFGGRLANQSIPMLVVTSALTSTSGQATEDGVLYAAPEPVSGSFKLMVLGQTTVALAFDADADTIEEALEDLSTVGEGNVAVAGSDLVTGMAITLQGALANVDAHVMPTESSLAADGPFGNVVTLIFKETTSGTGSHSVSAVVTQVTAPVQPILTSPIFSTSVTGRPQPQDGTDIKALDFVEWADAVPVDELWVKADNANSPISVTEG